MSAQLEETAIIGLRAQILDNLLLVKHETEDPIITTACNSEGWYAAIFSKESGYPIYGTRESAPTVVAALRNLLRYTSEQVEDKYQEFRDDTGYHDHISSTDTGYEFK